MTAHQVHELSRNCQPQPGTGTGITAVIICLAEFLEDNFQTFLRYTDSGIADADLHFTFKAVNAENDFTLLGKFNGITVKIQEYLPHPVIICQYTRQAAGEFSSQNNRFGADQPFSHFQSSANNRREIDLFITDFQLTRIYLRQVEDIINQN